MKKLAQLTPGSVDLAFADPPFNIGYDYDVYDDARTADEYLAWSRQWLAAVHRVLKPDGTFWLAIGDEFAAELKVIAQKDVGFHCRSWVVWYYTFGVNCTRKFSRSHAHLFHFVKDPKRFTFNADDPAIRVPSARQLVYADTRANPAGRLPDDTWILRPHDVPGGFTADQDTWYLPRVAGTFKERAGFHGCQMPERLLGRIILACSNPGDLVLDPFAGSGTTLAVAKKLHRDWIGTELSREYVAKVRARLKAIRPGQELDGPADPLSSAPSTHKGKRLETRATKRAQSPHVQPTPLTTATQPGPPAAGPAMARPSRVQVDPKAIVSAFRAASGGYSLDRLLADPELGEKFVNVCQRFGLDGEPRDWFHELLGLRKTSRLSEIGTSRRTHVSQQRMDLFRFASEIAWQQVMEGDPLHATSLDAILCDPRLAARFDELAAGLAPGFSPWEYRWGALQIRKSAERARRLVETSIQLPTPSTERLSTLDVTALRGQKGVYLMRLSNGKALYAGETSCLGTRLERKRELLQLSSWARWSVASVDVFACNELGDDSRRSRQSELVSRMRPALNVPGLYVDLATVA